MLLLILLACADEPSPSPTGSNPCTGCDWDGDGHPAPEDGGTDCDDADPGVHPGATEVCGGGDEDCDGHADDDDPTLDPSTRRPWYTDTDDDGYGEPGTAVLACDGHDRSSNAEDCDDADEEVHPEAEEVCGDGVDQDCDGHEGACTTRTSGDTG